MEFLRTAENKYIISESVVLNDIVLEGIPSDNDFSIISEEISPELVDGDILIDVLCISADPYLRGQMKMNGKEKTKMSGFVVGKIVDSKNNNWVIGDFIGASLPFSSVLKVSETKLSETISWKLTGYITDETASYGIGILGMPGSTAYGGLIDILKPVQGQTLFISAASGAVGALVGQLAKKIFNCKVIGSCGSEEKCSIITNELGFDASINYKVYSDVDKLTARLKELAPEGIDMYFENVGGYHFDAVMKCLNQDGRVAVCGAISQYNDAAPASFTLDAMHIIYKHIRVEGFICTPYLSGRVLNFLPDMHKYLTENNLVVKETYFNGISEWPNAFRSLFTGSNIGKVVVKLNK